MGPHGYGGEELTDSDGVLISKTLEFRIIQVVDEGADLNEEETAEEASPTPNLVSSEASKRADGDADVDKDVESPEPAPPIAPAATEAAEAEAEAPKEFSPSQQNSAAGDAEDQESKEVKGVDLEINTPEEERGV